MNIVTASSGEYLVLRVQNKRIDASNSSQLNSFLLSLVQDGNKKIIVDLSKVAFMDSSGLAGLLPVIKHLPDDGHLLITGLQARVEQLFKLTKLDTIFGIFSSVEEALVYEKVASGGPS